MKLNDLKPSFWFDTALKEIEAFERAAGVRLPDELRKALMLRDGGVSAYSSFRRGDYEISIVRGDAVRRGRRPVTGAKGRRASTSLRIKCVSPSTVADASESGCGGGIMSALALSLFLLVPSNPTLPPLRLHAAAFSEPAAAPHDDPAGTGVAAGIAAGVALATAGFIGGALLGYRMSNSIAWDRVAPWALISSALGAAGGAALGSLFATSPSGYRGSVGNAMLFGLAGVAVAAVIGFVPYVSEGPQLLVGAAVADVLAIAGALVGFRWGVPSDAVSVVLSPRSAVVSLHF